jgi:hypothetical protein
MRELLPTFLGKLHVFFRIPRKSVNKSEKRELGTAISISTAKTKSEQKDKVFFILEVGNEII